MPETLATFLLVLYLGLLAWLLIASHKAGIKTWIALLLIFPGTPVGQFVLLIWTVAASKKKPNDGGYIPPIA